MSKNPTFPGFKKAFNCELVIPEATLSRIPQSKIDDLSSYPVFEDKVKYAVGLFIERIEYLREVTPRPNVVLCALPKEIVEYCVVKRTKGGELVKKTTKKENEFLDKLRCFKRVKQTYIDGFQEQADRILEQAFRASNFWRSLKAGAMRYDMPTQIIWPHTSTPANELRVMKRQEDSITAWNISVALYYKGSGFPWTMTRLRQGTCYVGISFFKESSSSNKMRTSMAQIFTYTGEGLILRGDEFEWDPQYGYSPHLDESSAESLMNKAIDLYQRRMGNKPQRVVVHKSSKYWEKEKSGFEKVLKSISSYDLVAFGRRGLRFFRFGQYPPLRGTVVKMSNNSFLLYTRGYIPYLRTYPGAHVPLPLDIIEMHGDSDPQTVLSEILSLSKMNWNSADFSLAQPMTLLFSKRVGEIIANIDEKDLKHEYLYYM